MPDARRLPAKPEAPLQAVGINAERAAHRPGPCPNSCVQPLKGAAMLQDPLTLYKLIVLYMLDRVSFSMTAAQVSDFILEKDYTNFLTLQQVLNDLTESKLIASKTIRNRTHLSITPEGRETLVYFEGHISPAIKKEINAYFKEKEYDLRNELSVQGSYYKSTSGEYEARLVAKDRQTNLVEITLSVPTEEIASSICDNWQKKNQEIYQHLIAELF